MIFFNSTMEARKAMETQHISYHSVCAICSKELYKHRSWGPMQPLCSSIDGRCPGLGLLKINGGQGVIKYHKRVIKGFDSCLLNLVHAFLRTHASLSQRDVDGKTKKGLNTTDGF